MLFPQSTGTASKRPFLSYAPPLLLLFETFYLFYFIYTPLGGVLHNFLLFSANAGSVYTSLCVSLLISLSLGKGW